MINVINQIVNLIFFCLNQNQNGDRQIIPNIFENNQNLSKVMFMNEIFRTRRISQLPTLGYNDRS